MEEEKVLIEKEYKCKNIKNGIFCGESNPDKFDKGRFSKCNQCKKEYLKEYRVKVKKAKEIEMNIDLIERIDENVGSLGQNMLAMMEDMINNTPLKGMGISVFGKLQEMEEKIEINNNKMNIILMGMEKKINSLVKENEDLKNSEKDLKKDKDKLKRDFDELFKKYNDLLFKYEF